MFPISDLEKHFKYFCVENSHIIWKGRNQKVGKDDYYASVHNVPHIMVCLMIIVIYFSIHRLWHKLSFCYLFGFVWVVIWKYIPFYVTVAQNPGIV